MRKQKSYRKHNPGFNPKRSLKENQEIFLQKILPMEDEVRILVQKNIQKDQDVQDVCQQIFERCWRHLPELQDFEKVRAWVYRIAQRTISDYFRNLLRNREIPLSNFENDSLSEEAEIMISSRDARDLLDQILEEEDMRYFWYVFSQLDEKYRAVIWLWYDNQWFLNQVAEELEMNYHTVRSLFSRGLKKLRELYQLNEREKYNDK